MGWELRLTHPTVADRGLPLVIILDTLPLVLGRKPEGPNIQLLQPSQHDLRMAISRTHCSICYSSDSSIQTSSTVDASLEDYSDGPRPEHQAQQASNDILYPALEVVDHSRNGLYVNHQRMPGSRAVIRPGDLITFGAYVVGRRSEHGVTYVLTYPEPRVSVASSPAAPPHAPMPAVAEREGLGATTIEQEGVGSAPPVATEPKRGIKRGREEVETDADEGQESSTDLDEQKPTSIHAPPPGPTSDKASEGDDKVGAEQLRFKVADIIAGHRRTAAAAVATCNTAEDHVSLSVSSTQLSCAICMELLAGAALNTCGHASCFRCVHKSFFHRFVQESGLWGFNPDYSCATCRARIVSVSRHLLVDDLCERLVHQSQTMSAEDKWAWEARRADSQAIAEAYQQVHGIVKDVSFRPCRVDITLEYALFKKRINCRGCDCRIEAGHSHVKVSDQSAFPVGLNLGRLGRGTGAGFWHLSCFRQRLLTLISSQRSASSFCRLRFRVTTAARLSMSTQVEQEMTREVDAELSSFRPDWPWWVYEVKTSIVRQAAVSGAPRGRAAAGRGAAAISLGSDVDSEDEPLPGLLVDSMSLRPSDLAFFFRRARGDPPDRRWPGSPLDDSESDPGVFERPPPAITRDQPLFLSSERRSRNQQDSTAEAWHGPPSGATALLPGRPMPSDEEFLRVLAGDLINDVGVTRRLPERTDLSGNDRDGRTAASGSDRPSHGPRSQFSYRAALGRRGARLLARAGDTLPLLRRRQEARVTDRGRMHPSEVIVVDEQSAGVARVVRTTAN